MYAQDFERDHIDPCTGQAFINKANIRFGSPNMQWYHDENFSAFFIS